MLQASRIMKTSYRIAILIFLALVVSGSVQASVLSNLRVGSTDERTRLVFELEAAVPYRVSFGDSALDIIFTALDIPEKALQHAADSSGGMIRSLKLRNERGESVIHLEISGPFYLRYFDLVKPTRVVVDLYPKPDRIVPEALTQKPPPAPQPHLELEKPSLETQPPFSSKSSTLKALKDTAGASIRPLQVTQKSGVVAQKQDQASTPPVKDTRNPFPWLYVALPLAAVAVLAGLSRLRRRRLEPPRSSAGQATQSDLFRQVLDQEQERQAEEEIIPVSSLEEPEVLQQTLPEEPNQLIEPVAVEAIMPVESEIPVVEEPTESSPQPELIAEQIPAETSPPEAAPAVLLVAEETPILEPPIEEPEAKPIAEIIPVEPPQLESPDYAIIVDEPEAETMAEETYNVSNLGNPPPVELSMEAIKAELSDGWKSATSLEAARPEFKPEEGFLIWPVHLLDGGRMGRVLVVDDDSEVVNPVVEFLKREGYDAQGTTSSRHALDVYWEWRPDLLVLDVIMPELSGVDLVQEIREKEKPRKVIFLSGKSDRDNVTAAFHRELNDGEYEFFRKPVELRQIGDRVRDFFRSASDVLQLNVQDQKAFNADISRLGPHQLAALHGFVWDKVFETSAEMLGRRIEPFFITDRMEPAQNYMRRMGCMERVDYCRASVCIISNPLCAANRLRAEVEVMRAILDEFRREYMGRVGRILSAEEPKPARKKRKVKSPAEKSPNMEAVSAEVDTLVAPPPRKTVRRTATAKKKITESEP
jgi:FixJ family two-component response regulator